jgi:type II secretory pathway pseudopilin PulG
MNIIKINRRARQSGTTLVELSVVIAVILLLVGVLFVGVNAWRQGANKAACLLNIATVQKAVRAYENTNLKTEGVDGLAWANIVGTGLYFGAQPTCPSGGTYTLATTIPTTGTAALTCDFKQDGTNKNHVPLASQITNW